MTKELRMIQMILENGEAEFWHPRCKGAGGEHIARYNAFEAINGTVAFMHRNSQGTIMNRTYSSALELEKPKSVYDQLMDALFGNTSTHSWERIDKIKGLIRQHEDFLREK